MKSLRLPFNKTKKGAASLYVVVFATILFGVITVSFARIILSEASQSSNDDLSRSAYDAALAGVEDAKVMVNRYFTALAKGDTTTAYNSNIFGGEDCANGFPLGQKMHGVDGEVLLQESNNYSSETSADQAYTCVLVSDVVPDYRGTLTTDTRTKVIPININGATPATASNSGNTDIAATQKIQFSWYSDINQGSNDSTRLDPAKLAVDSEFNDKGTVPPTISLTFIKTGQSINLSDLHSADNIGEVIYSTMVFLPSNAASVSDNIINYETIKAAGNATNGDASSQNTPFRVYCSSDQEFACVATLQVGAGTLKSTDNVFLVVSLPYADAYTDFAVKLLDNDDNAIKLHGVQISVDSTGRTNQLVRRVETRLDPADMFFPYPQYALELSGGEGDHSLKKNFWVTANCWYSTPTSKNTLEAGLCANNGTVSGS